MTDPRITMCLLPVPAVQKVATTVTSAPKTYTQAAAEQSARNQQTQEVDPCSEGLPTRTQGLQHEVQPRDCEWAQYVGVTTLNQDVLMKPTTSRGKCVARGASMFVPIATKLGIAW